MHRIALFCASLGAMGCSGCFFGDRVLERQVNISQIATTGNAAKTFDIDSSQLPAGWIEKQSEQETLNGQKTTLRLAPDHRVKLVLIPEK